MAGRPSLEDRSGKSNADDLPATARRAGRGAAAPVPKRLPLGQRGAGAALGVPASAAPFAGLVRSPKEIGVSLAVRHVGRRAGEPRPRFVERDLAEIVAPARGAASALQRI